MKLLILLLIFVPSLCFAHLRTVQECTQGSNFIFHTAQSRDAKTTTKNEFMKKFVEKINMINSLQADINWFVQDEEDERFLGNEVMKVFDTPIKPKQHQVAFLKACNTYI